MARALRLLRPLLVAVLAASFGVVASTTPASAAPTWLPTVDVGSRVPFVDGYDVDHLPDGTTAVVWGEQDTNLVRTVSFATRGLGDRAFSPPEPLSGGFAFSPQLVVDTHGTVIVAWIQSANGNTVEVTRLEPGAEDWTTPEIVSRQSVKRFQLLVDQAGTVAVLSVREVPPEGEGPDTYRVDANMRPAGGEWSDWQAVAEESADEIVELSAVVDGAGRVTAVWEELAVGGSRVHAASSDETGAFVDTTLSGADVAAGVPDVAVTPGGGVAVSWAQQVSPGDDQEAAVMATRAPGGSSYSEPVSVATAQDDVLDTEIVVDGAGSTTVLTAAGTGGEYAVMAWTRPVGGPFSTQVLTLPGAVGIERMVVAAAADGALTALWQVGGFPSPGRVQAAHRVAGGDFAAATDLAPADDPDTTEDDASHFEPAVAVDSWGDATVVWEESGLSTGKRWVRSRVLDVAGPVVDQVAVPATATQGSGVTMSVSAVDHWSAPSTVAWSFGDGATATGASTSHIYTAGTYQVTATATDSAGNVTTVVRSLTVAEPAPLLPPAPPPPGDTVAPVLSGARVAPKALPVGRSAMLRLTSSEPAKVAGVVQRRAAGRWERVGGKQWSVKAGANSVKLYGRAAQPRLAPGKYRLRLVARDPAGNASITTSANFRVDRG